MNIIDLFPTKIYVEENVLDSDLLQWLYDYCLSSGEHSKVIHYSESLEFEQLRNIIFSKASLIAKEYNYTNTILSERFALHFFPPNAPQDMEIHTDDFGDVGRKFVAFLYLDCEQDAGGELEIFDPRWLNGPWHHLSSSIKIEPVTNKLVIFPSFLWHQVTTYHSKHFPRMALDIVVSVS